MMVVGFVSLAAEFPGTFASASANGAAAARAQDGTEGDVSKLSFPKQRHLQCRSARVSLQAQQILKASRPSQSLMARWPVQWRLLRYWPRDRMALTRLHQRPGQPLVRSWWTQ